MTIIIFHSTRIICTRLPITIPLISPDISVMKTQRLMPNDSLLYPGEYTPAPHTEQLLRKLRATHKATQHPPLNMDEYRDHFTIAVAVPGINREDIHITVHDNRLTICILCCKPVKARMTRSKVHEFDNGLQERHLVLPPNADSEFVSAEYKQGILQLHIPKSKNTGKTSNKHVAVY
jgi:HSP20 family protein